MPVLQEPAAVSIDTILLATDFSMQSEKASAYAAGMALRFHSTVDVTHVLDPSTVNTYEEALLGLPVGDRTKIYDERLRDICHALDRQGVVTRSHLPEGHDAVKAILSQAEASEAGLIVTGTRSKSGVERMLLGSTAEKLIRRANCPVMTVGPLARRPARGPIVFSDIVFATDLSPQSMKALPYALAFAEDSGAHLHLCMAMEDDSTTPSQREHLAEAFRVGLRSLVPESAYDWCTPDCVVEQGDAAKSILAVASRVDADLIVLGARQSSFWLSHVEHGLTPDIIASAICPVLTVC